VTGEGTRSKYKELSRATACGNSREFSSELLRSANVAIFQQFGVLRIEKRHIVTVLPASSSKAVYQTLRMIPICRGIGCRNSGPTYPGKRSCPEPARISLKSAAERKIADIHSKSAHGRSRISSTARKESNQQKNPGQCQRFRMNPTVFPRHGVESGDKGVHSVGRLNCAWSRTCTLRGSLNLERRK
jgi:hypothetical protein